MAEEKIVFEEIKKLLDEVALSKKECDKVDAQIDDRMREGFLGGFSIWASSKLISLKLPSFKVGVRAGSFLMFSTGFGRLLNCFKNETYEKEVKRCLYIQNDMFGNLYWKRSSKPYYNYFRPAYRFSNYPLFDGKKKEIQETVDEKLKEGEAERKRWAEMQMELFNRK